MNSTKLRNSLAFPNEHPDALHVPGAVIRVSSIVEQPKLEVA